MSKEKFNQAMKMVDQAIRIINKNSNDNTCAKDLSIGEKNAEVDFWEAYQYSDK